MTGSEAQAWRDAASAPDFFSAKGLIEALGAAVGCELEFSAYETGFLRPGRTARILTSAGEAGWLGELDPRVAADYGLPAGTAAFEIRLGALLAASDLGEEIFSDYSLQPPIYEDLAIVVDESVTADTVVATIAAAGGDLVESVEIFDIYRSDELGDGVKSLAARLTFRAAGRNLTDQEVASARQQIVVAIEGSGGKTRE